jgi:hypothetical protein
MKDIQKDIVCGFCGTINNSHHSVECINRICYNKKCNVYSYEYEFNCGLNGWMIYRDKIMCKQHIGGK